MLQCNFLPIDVEIMAETVLFPFGTECVYSSVSINKPYPSMATRLRRLRVPSIKTDHIRALLLFTECGS